MPRNAIGSGIREGDGSGHPPKRRRASLRGLHERLNQRRTIIGARCDTHQRRSMSFAAGLRAAR
jgi:hypothetical protein